jgi:demethylmenaquinone methyltransferase/2-methoxy-6-polyprenyl-1,4-benzoquinol methylase
VNLKELFNRIAKHYDLLNRLLSLGMDQRWRKKAVESLSLKDRAKIIDIASGTGDLAIKMSQKVKDPNIIGIDISLDMLKIAKNKVAKKRLGQMIRFIKADVRKLPFKDKSFDLSTIAFGIRNIKEKEVVFKEIKRVLKQNKEIMILEFFPPPFSFLGLLYKVYLKIWVPFLGGIFSEREAYFHLRNSILEFLSLEEFLSLMRKVGFRDITWTKIGFTYLVLARHKG